MRWVRAFMATSPLMDLLGAVVLCMILLYARGEIKIGRLTIGLFGVFTFALFKAYEPIKRLGNIYQLFQQALGASGRFSPSSICRKKCWKPRAATRCRDFPDRSNSRMLVSPTKMETRSPYATSI